jgi:hypothetical protein
MAIRHTIRCCCDRGRRGRRAAACRRWATAADFFDQAVELRIARQHRARRQFALTGQRMFEPVGEFGPFLARSRAEVAGRADCLLARPLGGLDRFNEDIIGVGLARVERRMYMRHYGTHNHAHVDTNVP